MTVPISIAAIFIFMVYLFTELADLFVQIIIRNQTYKNQYLQRDCNHVNQSHHVVGGSVNVEEIWTICDRCKKITNKRFEA
jgi:hypothetical protein